MNFLLQSILLASRLLALAAALSIATTASAWAEGTLTLTWDANPEPDIAGYIVFYGTQSGQYSSSVDVGSQTSFQLAGADPATPYFFAVRAYNKSQVRSAFSSEVSTTGSQLTITSLTSSVRAPQPTGAYITFTATASGGSGSTSYKWLVHDGSTWRVNQDWSAANSFTWTPSAVNPKYQIMVWARGAARSIDAPETPAASGSLAFPITGSLAVTSLAANVPSPQRVGTSITFTAAASGGQAPVQFKWLIFDGARWTTARNWAPANTYTWTPTTANPDFRIGVWVRSATSSADAPEGASAGTSLPFAITASTDVNVTRLKADKPSPQSIGARVVFSAAATGAKTYKYKWWVFNGKKWAVAQDWSSSSKFVWKPGSANAGYQVLVRVRDGKNAKRTSAGTSIPFPIAKKKR